MSISLRALAASAVALVVVAVPVVIGQLPGVTGTAQPDANSVGQAAAAADPALAQYFTQDLKWGPCASFASSPSDQKAFADPKFDCARLTVPLDYAKPDGRKIDIAMLRQKASDPAHRIGSLFTDPGGPGGSGVSFLPSFAEGVGNSPVAQRFDLIGFDPRGVGVSEPAIDCSNTKEIDTERADLDIDPSPAGVAQTEAEYKDFAKRCADRVGVDVLANVGTRDVARDLRIAAKVVGDEKLNYVGYSYGTQIGSEFAHQFPTDVRAMVLDGAIDPSLGQVESRVTQSRGFERAFDNFATACAQKPNCPLGNDPKQAPARLQQILKPLIQKPVPAGQGRTLGYTDAMTGVLTALYSQSTWGFLEQSLAQVAQGNGSGLLRLADAYYERNPDGSYSNLLEAFQAINCADTEPVTDRAVAKKISEESIKLAPFSDVGLGPSDALEQCSFWPVPPTRKAGPVTAPGLPPILVISSTGDPATPYEDGVSLAKQLGARLVTVDNDSHTVTLQASNQCVDTITTRYLVDLALPAPDAKCGRS